MLHSEARQVLTRAFQKVAGRTPTPSELGYCQAVGWLETFYGRGGQFAKLFARGVVNWGALETSKTGGACPPGTAGGTDLGDVCFYAYDTDDAAATAFLTTLLTANRTPGKSPVQARMIQAMAGSPEDVAQAMKDAGYYGAEVSAYAQAIQNSLAQTSGPGGITDQGMRFVTAAPPAGTPPQTPATPGAKPGSSPSRLAALASPRLLLGGAAVVLGVLAWRTFGNRSTLARGRVA